MTRLSSMTGGFSGLAAVSKTFGSVPGVPTVGTATVSLLTATVPFTAPTCNGGFPINKYYAVSSPGCITGNISQSGSGSITVSGLSKSTSYTFVVYAHNPWGNSAASGSSNSVTTAGVPTAPTITAVTWLSSSSAKVTYSASSSNGGAVITSYTAVPSAGGSTGTASTACGGTITVGCLNSGCAYTFTAYATNSLGNGPSSSPSSSLTIPGQVTFCGSTGWTVPAGVTKVHVVAIGGGGGGSAGTGKSTSPGGGGGGGGGLGWKNCISVTPGSSVTVQVGGGGCSSSISGFCKTQSPYPGGCSYFISLCTVSGKGGGGAKYCTETGGAGGGYVGTGGGNGGAGGSSHCYYAGGGGGAGGYAGAGGAGEYSCTGRQGNGGAGGGGGGSSTEMAGGGGGVLPCGQGTNGAAGAKATNAVNSSGAGGGGSGGSAGTIGVHSGTTTTGGSGGAYGGGGGGATLEYSVAVAGGGAQGVVRVIWGTCRAFPSTNTHSV